MLFRSCLVLSLGRPYQPHTCLADGGGAASINAHNRKIAEALFDRMDNEQVKGISDALKHGHASIHIEIHNWEVAVCDVTLKNRQPTTGGGEPSFDF